MELKLINPTQRTRKLLAFTSGLPTTRDLELCLAVISVLQKAEGSIGVIKGRAGRAARQVASLEYSMTGSVLGLIRRARSRSGPWLPSAVFVTCGQQFPILPLVLPSRCVMLYMNVTNNESCSPQQISASALQRPTTVCEICETGFCWTRTASGTQVDPDFHKALSVDAWNPRPLPCQF